jgi:hypothetical protein
VPFFHLVLEQRVCCQAKQSKAKQSKAKQSKTKQNKQENQRSFISTIFPIYGCPEAVLVK